MIAVAAINVSGTSMLWPASRNLAWISVQPFKEFENCNAADGEFLVTLQISKQVSQTILRPFGAWVLECPLNIKQGATVYEAFIHAT